MTTKPMRIRVELHKDSLKIIALKSSPRGTKYMGKGVQVSLPFSDKKARKSEIEKAIVEVTTP